MGLRIGTGFKVFRGVSAKVVPVVYEPEYGDPAGAVYFGWETVPLTTSNTGIVIKDTITRELVDPGIILPDNEVVSFSGSSIVIKDTITRELVDPGTILPNNDGVIYSDNISIT